MPNQPKRKAKMLIVPDRYAMFMENGADFESLSDEEIWRGQLKDSRGNFAGRPPRALPREFMLKLLEEQHRRFSDALPAMVKEAMETLALIMKKPNPSPGDAARVKAATYIIDRFAGKTPETVHMLARVETTFEDVARDILVDVEEDEK